MENETTQELLKVSFNNETGAYSVSIAKGSNAAETAFCMTVVIKCFLREKIIDNAKEMIDLIQKYCDDPAYEEVKSTENAEPEVTKDE